MANFEHPSSAISSLIVVATSADPKATGTSAHFSHPIRQLTVDDPHKYQIALVSIDFDHPGGTPVYVSCNLAALTRYGSGEANILYRIGDHAAGTLNVQQTGSIVLYYPYDSYTTADFIEIGLTDSTGAFIATGWHTTVTLSIRRV